MSTPDKPDHARGWLYVEKLLDEDYVDEAEEERIKGLTDEQVRAEIRDGSTDDESVPGPAWSADDFLARAEALAAKEQQLVVPAVPAANATPAALVPTTPDAPVPATKASPAPPPPELATPPEKLAPVVPIHRWRITALLAAACFALFLFVKFNQPDAARPPTNHDLAEAQRDAAEASCALKDWVACKASLDDARRLDPAGESEPRVQKARQDIAAGMATPR